MSELAFESIGYVTQEQFARWIEERPGTDINHYELLNGRIVMTPPAGWPHGRSGNRVNAKVTAFVDAHGLGVVLGSSQGYALPSGDTVEADTTFISNERWRAGPAPEEGKFLRIVPDLVIEVLSPSTASRDRGEKKAIYERNGVREYWIVDQRATRVVRFLLRGDRFDLGAAFDAEDTLESEVLPGFRCTVRELLGR